MADPSLNAPTAIVETMVKAGANREQVLQWWNALPPQDRMQVQSDWQHAVDPNMGFIEQMSGGGQKRMQAFLQKTMQSMTDNAQARKNQGEFDKTTAEIQKFHDMMQAPIQDQYGNYKDSIAQQLAFAGQGRAQQIAGAGVRGGVSSQIAQATTQSALLPYLQQRQQNEMQTNQLLSNRQIGLEQLKQSWAGIQNQNAQQNWAAQMNQAQGQGALIGGTLGAVAGSFIPGVGPAAGWGIGSGIGGGIGGMNSSGGIAPRTYGQSNTFLGGSRGYGGGGGYY